MSARAMVFFHISALFMGFIDGGAGWLLLGSQVSAATDELDVKSIKAESIIVGDPDNYAVVIREGQILVKGLIGVQQLHVASDRIEFSVRQRGTGHVWRTMIQGDGITYIPLLMKDMQLPQIYTIPFNQILISDQNLRPASKGTPWTPSEETR